MNDVRVLIVAGCDATSERQVLRGFHEVALLRGWDVLRYVPHVADLKKLIKEWDPSAIVLSWNVPTPYPAFLRGRVLVAMHGDHPHRTIPSIVVNDELVGRLAGEHLLQTGIKDFATFWYQSHPFATRRAAGFSECIRSGGARLHQQGEFGTGHAYGPEPTHETIIDWLKSLPKPCGIFACCDHWASSLAYYCRAIDARIPEDIALIGAENDEMECEISSPPISSVAIPWFRAGGELAKLVDEALRGGGVAKPQRVTIDPTGVVARRSTHVLAVADEEVAAALRYIHDHAHEPIGVPEILRVIPVYRQRLERRFRLLLGRTIMEEVRRARIELARNLLRATSQSIPEVAQRSGFGSATMLGITFRKETGLTPTEFRRRCRGEAVPERRGD